MYKLLTQCPLFRGLSEESIHQVIDQRGDYVLTQYRDGELIAQRDTAYSGLMIVLSGRVVGLLTDSSGKAQVVDSVEASQLIAPAFLFGGCNKLPVDVVAQGEVSILTLHRGYLFELMQENVLVLSNFIDIVSNRANVWSRKMYLLSLSSLREKLTAYLLERAVEGDVITMPDLSDLAVAFEVTRAAVQATLKDLQKRHLITLLDGQIRIENRRALQDIVPLHQ